MRDGKRTKRGEQTEVAAARSNCVRGGEGRGTTSPPHHRLWSFFLWLVQNKTASGGKWSVKPAWTHTHTYGYWKQIFHFLERSCQLSQLPRQLEPVSVSVVYSNHLLRGAQRVSLRCVVIISLPGVNPVIYSFLIHLHTVMWDACISGIPTVAVTSGFYPVLEELCLTVSCCDLQEQKAPHSSQHLWSVGSSNPCWTKPNPINSGSIKMFSGVNRSGCRTLLEDLSLQQPFLLQPTLSPSGSNLLGMRMV